LCYIFNNFLAGVHNNKKSYFQQNIQKYIQISVAIYLEIRCSVFGESRPGIGEIDPGIGDTARLSLYIDPLLDSDVADPNLCIPDLAIATVTS
jgi:hypothetical protein